MVVTVAALSQLLCSGRGWGGVAAGAAFAAAAEEVTAAVEIDVLRMPYLYIERSTSWKPILKFEWVGVICPETCW